MRTFNLPDLGEGLKEAEIVAWHVAAGDRIVADQPLVSVETAKAVVDVPSPWSGVVRGLRAKPGEIVPLGGALVDIDTDGGVSDGDSGTVVGTLPQPKPAPSISARDGPTPGERVRISPAARRLGQELGVDPMSVAGTGPEGSITREDVELAARSRRSGEGYEPLRGVRRAMAETMERASAGVVAATVSDEAVIDSWSADGDPTIRLIRAVAAGCRASPSLNAWLDSSRRARLLHKAIDLGIAMETEDGLFAPVLRDVGRRGNAELRAGLDAMKRDVAARTVPLAELRGQTITLSNFGMLGGLTAALTIVPPQVAILGAGRMHRGVRVVDGEIKAVRILPLSLTFDHRAVTGAEAICFLNAALEELAKP